MRESINLFKRRVIAGLKDDFAGMVDSVGRIGFATNEDDRGENTPGRHVDLIKDAAAMYGLRVSVMPFPCSGKLVYEVVARRR